MKRILTLLVFAVAALGQPDCMPGGNGDFLFPNGNGTISFDNRQTQCVTWLIAYDADPTVMGFTLVFNSSTGINTPSGYSTYPGTQIAATASFGTAVPALATYSNIVVAGTTVDTPWVQVTSSGGSGFGAIRGHIYGYRLGATGGTGGGGGSGGTGCPNPCPVTQSTSPWVDSITRWATGVLGAMANYGTSPGAVLVPGVNAFITNTVPVTPAGLGTFTSGQQAVTNSAANLGTATAKNVCVSSLITSTVETYVGASGVTTSTGFQLSPGQGACWQVNNTNLLYVIATGAGASVSWTLTN